MPTIDLDSIGLYYEQESSEQSNAETLVLINGLADDLNAWDAQVPAFTSAGYNILRYDNRGIGRSSAPAGPYTSQIMAKDLFGLLEHLKIMKFHLLGISMGGMIAQTYALTYPNGSSAANGHEMLSLSLCCTYAEPTTFCSRMFSLWADMAGRMSVQDVMRDVILWCFTLPFFRTRESELKEVDEAMNSLKMSTEAYLAQLNVIQGLNTCNDLKQLQADDKVLGNVSPGRVMVLAGKTDILIPLQLSRELSDLIVSSRWTTTKGGHACSVSYCTALLLY